VSTGSEAPEAFFAPVPMAMLDSVYRRRVQVEGGAKERPLRWLHGRHVVHLISFFMPARRPEAHLCPPAARAWLWRGSEDPGMFGRLTMVYQGG
jgi:hypothetical protein